MQLDGVGRILKHHLSTKGDRVYFIIKDWMKGNIRHTTSNLKRRVLSSSTGIFRVSANVRGDICQSNLATIRACIIKYKVEWRHTTIKQIRRGEDRY